MGLMEKKMETATYMLEEVDFRMWVEARPLELQCPAVIFPGLAWPMFSRAREP